MPPAESAFERLRFTCVRPGRAPPFRPMPLTSSDVRRIAELARLDLGAAEEARMLEQINSFFRIV